MNATLARVRLAKMTLLGVLFVVTGAGLIVLNKWLSGLPLGPWDWLHTIPFSELGASLFGIGVVGTAYDYYTRRDEEENAVRRLRETLKSEAPVMRDAVLEAFAVKRDDLKRVATPELLDDIATNAISLRLGDEQFASEIYCDIRDQAIRSAERWHDVEVRARLSTAVERGTRGTPLFDLTVEWEYTTVPVGPIRRFVCTSDREEYGDLLLDMPSTSPWLMMPRPGMDPSLKQSYELLEFTIDGEPQAVRHSARKSGQIYTVRLSPEMANGDSRRIRYIFRTVTPTWGHRLYFELPQPARKMSVLLDYSDTDIADLRVSDTVPTSRHPVVVRSPKQVSGKQVEVNVDGWLLPRSGFAFSWTLEAELPQSLRSEAA